MKLKFLERTCDLKEGDELYHIRCESFGKVIRVDDNKVYIDWINHLYGDEPKVGQYERTDKILPPKAYIIENEQQKLALLLTRD